MARKKEKTVTKEKKGKAEIIDIQPEPENGEEEHLVPVENEENLPEVAKSNFPRKMPDGKWVYVAGKEISNFFSRVKNKFAGITVYALVGKSGTGKSFRAKLLAEKLGVSFIIDDGLLIFGDIIVAGRSAKQANGYLNAIKTALFTEDSHRDMVKVAIKEQKVKKLLLLGTSTKMVRRVAERLDLPPITQIIKIEEIASQEDIEAAIKSRFEEGKHVIPVPAIEIKRDYSKILRDSIRIFFSGEKRKVEKKNRFFEKSIVQPEFTDDRRAGKVTITEAALSQMIFHCIDEYDSDILVKRLRIKILNSGFNVAIDLIIPFGKTINTELEELRNYICNMIQRYTGIIIEHLELAVAEIAAPPKAIEE